MSRTKKGSKGPGHEYWGRRPLNNSGCDLGTKNKRIGIQKERARTKSETDSQCKDPTCTMNNNESSFFCIKCVRG